MNLMTKLMPAHVSLVRELECARAADLQSLQERIAVFQESRFGGQTLAGKLTHMAQEVQELRADPGDSMEWADVLILLLGAAHMAGMSVADLRNAAVIKMGINEQREWGLADEDGVVHHVAGNGNGQTRTATDRH